jgi:hypothetical protein
VQRTDGAVGPPNNGSATLTNGTLSWSLVPMVGYVNARIETTAQELPIGSQRRAVVLQFEWTNTERPRDHRAIHDALVAVGQPGRIGPHEFRPRLLDPEGAALESLVRRLLTALAMRGTMTVSSARFEPAEHLFAMSEALMKLPPQ